MFAWMNYCCCPVVYIFIAECFFSTTKDIILVFFY